MTTPGSAPARRKILLITPRWPYPVVGGDALRIWQLARDVSERHELTLLSLCQSTQELHAPLPSDGVFSQVHRVLLPRWRSWLQMLAALPGDTPLQVAYYQSSAFRAAVQALAPQHDLVWAHLVRMAPYLSEAAVPACLEMTDAISMTMARLGEQAAHAPTRRLNAWRARAYRLEARRLQPYEAAAGRRARLACLIAAPDRDYLYGAAPSDWPPQLVVAPNGVSLPMQALSPAGERAPGIAFVGQLRSAANRDALAYLAADILPRVRARIPQGTLHVVGPCPDDVSERWRDTPGLRLHGVVPELATVLGQCRVGACPVRVGAGMQNKLLDYLAHGLAAVTSPVGLEGLQAQAGQDLLVAHDTEQWVDQICQLLRNDTLASALGASGQRLVAQHYSWAQALRPFTEALDRLLASGH